MTMKETIDKNNERLQENLCASYMECYEILNEAADSFDEVIWVEEERVGPAYYFIVHFDKDIPECNVFIGEGCYPYIFGSLVADIDFVMENYLDDNNLIKSEKEVEKFFLDTIERFIERNKE